jgi:hypothetical protein
MNFAVMQNANAPQGQARARYRLLPILPGEALAFEGCHQAGHGSAGDAHLGDNVLVRIEIGADEVAPLLGVKGNGSSFATFPRRSLSSRRNLRTWSGARTC